MDAYRFSRQSDPDLNPRFRGWHRLPADAAALDRMADAELAEGNHHAADKLAWTAAGLREVAR